MRANSFKSKSKRPADYANNQLVLFNHSVLAHDVAETVALCANYAEKARCIMQAIQQIQKPTYPQEWTSYNQAQTNEKARFLELLYELCQSIDEMPRKPGAGRTRLPLGNMIFCAVWLCTKIQKWYK